MDRKAFIFNKSLPEPNSGCWIWLGEHRADGYGESWAFGRREAAHRASFRIFHGPIPSDLMVRHKCDTRCCVNPDHLELGTQADNVRDCVERGRKARGPKSGRAKLTDADVLYIRSSPLSQRAIAKELGVTQAQVSNIRARKQWAHLTAYE